ncbi:TLC domain-containing protein At5g14285 [Silene latifolia]|uniref:TLC domain-containing protein At5g14285 n=1 Tax=Silene latifolia TaxID=37657 RepID=UPI003D77D0F5
MEEIKIQSSYYDGLKLPQFFMFFTIIYTISHKVFKNWNPKLKYEACSCFLSLFHGTPSVILAVSAIFLNNNTENPEKTSVFAAENTDFQNIVLEFSTGYFLMDLLHYFVFKPDDVLFIAHHLATLFTLLTCRFLVNHGAFAILVILVIAEVTSACQNVWSLARLRKNDLGIAAKVYNFLVPEFYAFYTVARGVFVPLFVLKMGLVYTSGAVDNVIPTWVWCSWMMLTVSGIFASLLWILSHWIVFFKERMSKQH